VHGRQARDSVTGNPGPPYRQGVTASPWTRGGEQVVGNALAGAAQGRQATSPHRSARWAVPCGAGSRSSRRCSRVATTHLRLDIHVPVLVTVTATTMPGWLAYLRLAPIGHSPPMRSRATRKRIANTSSPKKISPPSSSSSSWWRRPPCSYKVLDAVYVSLALKSIISTRIRLQCIHCPNISFFPVASVSSAASVKAF